jgi:hypothetical protein
MPTYYRRDEEVVDSMGNAVMGVQIAVASQPANTSVFPPTPSVKLFADSVGTPLRINPPQSDAYGRVSYYALPGVYTVCYFSPQIATPTQTLVLTDQIISTETNLPSFNSDSTFNGTITPAPNGVTVGFNLSAAPAPPSSLILMVNGQVINAYAFANSTVIFETAPTAGSVITATYAV